jgi:hypothetical protein
MNDGQTFNTYRLSLNDMAEVRIALISLARITRDQDKAYSTELLRLKDRFSDSAIVMVHKHTEN